MTTSSSTFNLGETGAIDETTSGVKVLDSKMTALYNELVNIDKLVSSNRTIISRLNEDLGMLRQTIGGFAETANILRNLQGVRIDSRAIQSATQSVMAALQMLSTTTNSSVAEMGSVAAALSKLDKIQEKITGSGDAFAGLATVVSQLNTALSQFNISELSTRLSALSAALNTIGGTANVTGVSDSVERAAQSMDSARKRSDNLAKGLTTSATQIAAATKKTGTAVKELDTAMKSTFSKGTNAREFGSGLFGALINVREQLSVTSKSAMDNANSINNALQLVASGFVDIEKAPASVRDLIVQMDKLAKSSKTQDLNVNVWAKLADTIQRFSIKLKDGTATQHDWDNFMKKITQGISKGNSVMTSFVDTITTFKAAEEAMGRENTLPVLLKAVEVQAKAARQALAGMTQDDAGYAKAAAKVEALDAALETLKNAPETFELLAKILPQVSDMFDKNHAAAQNFAKDITLERNALFGVSEVIDKSLETNLNRAAVATQNLGNKMKDTSASGRLLFTNIQSVMGGIKVDTPANVEASIGMLKKTLAEIDALIKRGMSMDKVYSIMASGSSRWGQAGKLVVDMLVQERQGLQNTEGLLVSERNNIVGMIDSLNNIRGASGSLDALASKFTYLKEVHKGLIDSNIKLNNVADSFASKMNIMTNNVRNYQRSLQSLVALSANVSTAINNNNAAMSSTPSGTPQYDELNKNKTALEALNKAVKDEISSVESGKLKYESYVTALKEYKNIATEVTGIESRMASIRNSSFARATSKTDFIASVTKTSDLDKLEKQVETISNARKKLDELSARKSKLGSMSEFADLMRNQLNELDQEYVKMADVVTNAEKALQTMSGVEANYIEVLKTSIQTRREALAIKNEDSAMNRNLNASLQFAKNLHEQLNNTTEESVGTLRKYITEMREKIKLGDFDLADAEEMNQRLMQEMKYRSNHIRLLEAQKAAHQTLAGSIADENNEHVKAIRLIDAEIVATRRDEDELSRLRQEMQNAAKNERFFESSLEKSIISSAMATHAMFELSAAANSVDSSVGRAASDISTDWRTIAKEANKQLGSATADITKFKKILLMINERGTAAGMDSDAIESLRAGIQAAINTIEMAANAFRELGDSAIKSAEGIDVAEKALLAYNEAMRVGGGAGGIGGGGGGGGIGGRTPEEIEKSLEKYSKLTKTRVEEAQAAKLNASEILRENAVLSKNNMVTQENIDVAENSRKEVTRRLQALNQLRAMLINVMQAETKHKDQYQDLIGVVERAATGMGQQAAQLKYVSEGYRGWRKELRSTIDELRSTIDMQWRNFASFTLIFGALSYGRTLLREYIEEQNQLGRALSASRSPMMDLEERLSAISDAMDKARTRFGLGATEIGEALYQLGSAGLTVEETMAGLVPTLNLVVGANANVEDMTKMLASTYNILNQRSLMTGNSMRDMAHLADVVAVIYRDNQIEVNEFVNALKYVIPVADQAGVSFEELAAILGTLHTQGIKAGLAGRQLRAIFYNIQQNRKVVEEAFADANIRIDPTQPLKFMDIMQKLADGVNNGTLSIGKMDKIIQALGIRGTGTFLVLAKSMGLLKQNIELATKYSEGQAQAIADIRIEKFNKELEITKQNFYLLAKTIFGATLGAFGYLMMAFNAIAEAVVNLNNALGGIPATLVSVVGFLASLYLGFGMLKRIILTVIAAISLITDAKIGSAAASGIETVSENANVVAKERNVVMTGMLDVATNKLVISNLELAAANGASTTAMGAWQASMVSAQAGMSGLLGKIGMLKISWQAIAVAVGIAVAAIAGFVIYSRTATYRLNEYKEALQETEDALSSLRLAEVEIEKKKVKFDTFIAEANKYNAVLRDTTASIDERNIAEENLQRLLNKSIYSDFSNILFNQGDRLNLSVNAINEYKTELEELANIQKKRFLDEQGKQFDSLEKQFRDNIKLLKSYEGEIKNLDEQLASQRKWNLTTGWGKDTGISGIKKEMGKIKPLLNEATDLGIRFIIKLREIDHSRFDTIIASLGDDIPDALRKALGGVEEVKRSMSSIDDIEVKWTIAEKAERTKTAVYDLIVATQRAEAELANIDLSAAPTVGSWANMVESNFVAIQRNVPEFTESLKEILVTSLESLATDFDSKFKTTGNQVAASTSKHIRDTVDAIAATGGDFSSIQRAFEVLGMYNNLYNKSFLANNEAQRKGLRLITDGVMQLGDVIMEEVDRMMRLSVAYNALNRSIEDDINKSKTYTYGNIATMREELAHTIDNAKAKEKLLSLDKIRARLVKELTQKQQESLQDSGAENEFVEQKTRELNNVNEEMDKYLQSNRDAARLVFEINKAFTLQNQIISKARMEYARITRYGEHRGDQITYELRAAELELGFAIEKVKLDEKDQQMQKALINELVIQHDAKELGLRKELLKTDRDILLARNASIKEVASELEGNRGLLSILTEIGGNYQEFQFIQEDLGKLNNTYNGLIADGSNKWDAMANVMRSTLDFQNMGIKKATQHLVLLRELQQALKAILNLWRDFMNMQREAIGEQQSYLMDKYQRNIDVVSAKLQQLSELRPFDFMLSAMSLLGKPVESADEALDELIDKFEQGTISAQQLGRVFGDVVGAGASEMRTQFEGINSLIEQNTNLTKKMAEIDINMLSQMMASPQTWSFQDLDMAKELMSNIIGYIRDIQQVDPDTANRMQQAISGLAGALAQLTFQRRDDIMVKVGLNVDDFKNQLDAMTTAYEQFIRGLSAKGLVEVKFGVESMVFGKAFTDELESRLKVIINAAFAERAIGRASGGRIGGSGSGDTVPAMLTPGEFVLPVDVVKRIGSDTLYRLINGGMSPEDLLNLVQSISDMQYNNKAAVKSLRRGESSFFAFLNKTEDVDTEMYRIIRGYMKKYAGKYNKGGAVAGIQHFAGGGSAANIKPVSSALNGVVVMLPDDADTKQYLASLLNSFRGMNYKAADDANKAYKQRLRIDKPFMEQLKLMRNMWKSQVSIMMDETNPLFIRAGYAAGQAFAEGFSGAVESGMSAVQTFLSALFDFQWMSDKTFESIADAMDQAKETYADGLEDLVKQLRRNEISYFQYLNRLEDLQDKFNDDVEKAQKKDIKDDPNVERIDNIIDAIHQGFSAVIGGFADTIMSTFTSLLSTASNNAFNDIYASISIGVKGIFGVLGGSFDEELKTLSSVFGGFGTDFMKIIDGISSIDIKGTLGKLFGGIDFNTVFANVGRDINKVVSFTSNIFGRVSSYITKIASSVGDWLSSTFASVDSAVGGAFTKVGNFLGGVVDVFASIDFGKVMEVIDGFASIMGSAISAVSDYIGAVIGVASVYFSIGAAIASMGASGVTSFFTGMKKNEETGEMEKVGDSIFETISKLVDQFIDDMPEIMEALVKNIPLVIDALIKALPQIIELMNGAVLGLIDILVENMPKIVELLKVVVSKILDGVIEGLPKLMGMLGDLLVGLIDVIINVLLARLPELITALLKGISSLVAKLLPAIANLIAGLLKQLPAILSSIIQGILEVVVTIVEQLPGMIETIIQALPEMIENLMKELPKIITKLAELLPRLVPALIKLIPVLIWEIIKAIPLIVIELAKGLGGVIKSIVVDLGRGILETFKSVGQLLWDKIVDAFKWIRDQLVGEDSFFGKVGNYFKELGGAAAGFFGKVGSGAKKVWDWATSWHNGGMVAHSGAYVAHNGLLASDERMIIAQTGEGILSRDAMKNLGIDRFNMLNSGMSLENMIAASIGNKYSDWSAGLPQINNYDESTASYNEGDINEGDWTIQFNNCSFTSDNVADVVEHELVARFKDERGELQKLIRGKSDNVTKQIRGRHV